MHLECYGFSGKENLDWFSCDNKGSQKLLLNGLARNIIIQYQIKNRLEIEQLYWILVTLHWCYTCGVAILFTLKKDASKEIRVPIMEQ